MTGELDDLSDADLIVLARDGDTLAYGVLWKRHWQAGRAMAASITGRFDPDDLASEAFARILTSLGRGKGPTSGFRSYLATTVRNVAIDWSRRKTTPNIEDADVIEDWTFSEVTALERMDRQTMAKAFYALPDKWQEVLWYTEIEDMAPREVAPLMGLNANAVSALALRAREGLRQSWINAHLASAPTEDPIHAWTLKKLGPFVRGRLAKADRRKVTQHLDACERCADAASEADRVGSRIALGILPLFLGLAGATAYLSTIGGSGTAVAATLTETTPAAPAATDPAATVRTGGRLRQLSSAATGSSKAGMAAVAASVVAAAALTCGVVVAAPGSELAAAETGSGSTSGSQSAGGDRPDRVAETSRPTPEQKAQLKPEAPATGVVPVPAPDGDGSAPPVVDSPITEPIVPVVPSGPGAEAPVLPPDPAPAPAPQGCVAAIQAIPAADTLLAYRLDDESGARTATDLVHGSTARYAGHPGAGEWNLTDETLRQPVDRFTIQIWFQATEGGGRLLGFSGSSDGVSAYYDRHLFLTDDGRLVFGVFPEAVRTVTSTSSYTDGRWHQATATLSDDGMALYVDGERVAHDGSVTQAHAFPGHWRIGADNLDNWGPETPSARQITGSLAFAAVYGVPLSAEQVRAQWKLCS
ncbi:MULTISPECIES: sigma-70 family RNA polymerase sigma factor [unclassified Leifsonia]|uniref:sigma-70 family RNA polymerase sigma factor n=1 Tax=unclassified Leifsonia TaxID=2663824 RepID=UPI00035FDDF7|nr:MULTISPECIES: sigma-70 family RNA polymerase sigma factor [unclassified Leifsonia]TDQ02066.1 RNA polymerase sigma factor (sigma-70 family) [Leifsonia sp. 115AMFTsu3.1]